MKTIVAAGLLGTRMRYNLAPILPREGDTVRFRYTPATLTLVEVKGDIAVVHGPQGGFACKASDLRRVS